MITEKEQKRTAVRRGDRLDVGYSYLGAEVIQIEEELRDLGYYPTTEKGHLKAEVAGGFAYFGEFKARVCPTHPTIDLDPDVLKILYDYYPHSTSGRRELLNIVVGISFANYAYLGLILEKYLS